MTETKTDPFGDPKKDEQKDSKPVAKEQMLTAVSKIIMLRPEAELVGLDVPQRRSAKPLLKMVKGESKSLKEIEKAIGSKKTEGMLINTINNRGQLIETEKYEGWLAKKAQELSPKR